MSIVTSNWLIDNLDKVKIIDSSWHLPNQKRDAIKEYEQKYNPQTNELNYNVTVKDGAKDVQN